MINLLVGQFLDVQSVRSVEVAPYFSLNIVLHGCGQNRFLKPVNGIRGLLMGISSSFSCSIPYSVLSLLTHGYFFKMGHILVEYC